MGREAPAQQAGGQQSNRNPAERRKQKVRTERKEITKEQQNQESKGWLFEGLNKSAPGDGLGNGEANTELQEGQTGAAGDATNTTS